MMRSLLLIALLSLASCSGAEQTRDFFADPKLRCSTGFIHSERDGRCELRMLTICPEGIKSTLIELSPDTTWVP